VENTDWKASVVVMDKYTESRKYLRAPHIPLKRVTLSSLVPKTSTSSLALRNYIVLKRV
jgi:hypothetical protein